MEIRFSREWRYMDILNVYNTFVFMDRLSPYSANYLGRRVASFTTRDAKEIAKLLTMLP